MIIIILLERTGNCTVEPIQTWIIIITIIIIILLERTGNCTVEPIQTWMGDAARMEGRPVRLKLASELLQVNGCSV